MGEMQNGIATLKSNLLAYKVNQHLSNGLAILCLGIYPREIETFSHDSPYTNIYSDLFKITKCGTQMSING